MIELDSCKIYWKENRMSFSSANLDFKEKFWIYKGRPKISERESLKTSTFINDQIYIK